MLGDVRCCVLGGGFGVHPTIGTPAGPATSAVSLRAVSLLLIWRQKLEAVADGEETLVEVVKALSAASHYSTSQGSDYCNQFRKWQS